MKHFSNFSPDYSNTDPDVSEPNLPSNWRQEAEDEKFRLSLAQTRDELRQALRYRQAYELLRQGMEEIAEKPALPPEQKRTAESYMRILRKTWPELAE